MRTCYWCGEEIPFTIHPEYWYCFHCRRRTESSVPNGDRYTGHLHKWTRSIGPKAVLSTCEDRSCTVMFWQTLEEYQRDQRKEVMKDEIHSQEFAEHLRNLPYARQSNGLKVFTVPVVVPTQLDWEKYQKHLDRKAQVRQRRFDRRQARKGEAK